MPNKRAMIVGGGDNPLLASALSTSLAVAGYAVDSWATSVWLPTGTIPAGAKAADVVIGIITNELETVQSRLLETLLGYAKELGRPTLIFTVDHTATSEELPKWITDAPTVIIRPVEDEAGAGVAAAKIMSVLFTLTGIEEARQEDRQQLQERVEQQSAVHLQPVIDELRRQQDGLKYGAYAFYLVAIASLCVGLLFSLVRVWQAHYHPAQNWTQIGQSSISALIVIGMLTAVARLAFVLGRSFMVESLTNGDRAHAISFGRFFLQAYGDRAEWKDIKDAFEKWNVDRGSSFSSLKASDADPMFMKVISDGLKAAASAASKASKDKDKAD